MYFAVVDGGTTNTSVYIIDQNLSILPRVSGKWELETLLSTIAVMC